MSPLNENNNPSEPSASDGEQGNLNKMQTRRDKILKSAEYEEAPTFPRVMLIEISNICNHSCAFCAYSKMTRPHQTMAPAFFKRIMREAYDLGTRDVGLHAGTEPFACKHIVEFIAECKAIGYEYVYVTTNGSIPKKEKLKAAIDAGIDSLKFSINAGDAETYAEIHGKPHFDRVLENVRFVSEYRKTLGRPFHLGASFIEVEENTASFASMEEILLPLVDEIYRLPAGNQSGQMSGGYSVVLPEICPLPFVNVNISVEGHLRACCNDYQNMLVVEDLNKVSLIDAWNGETYRELRRKHIEDRLEGTLCYDCVKDCHTKVAPIRPDLADWGQI